MVLRSTRLANACGRTFCDPAAAFLDSCSSDQEYYDTAPAKWLMWGAAHREGEVAAEVFNKAIRRYPSTDPALQALAESIGSSSDLSTVRHSLRVLGKQDDGSNQHFLRAVDKFLGWLQGQLDDTAAVSITNEFIRHSGYEGEFGTWLRTEITFDIWSRGIE